jgi:exonuclease III
MAFFVACGVPAVASAQTLTVRIVTYNIEDDVGATAPLPGLIADSSGNVTNGGVLEGIGEEILAGNNQPVDVLALQETTNSTLTVQPILKGLNDFYSSRSKSPRYAMSSLVLTTTGGTGGGPSALVYNTNTVQLLESVGVGTPSGSGEPRQVGRYLLAPAGVATNASNIFYIYVSHAKSGTSSNDINRRAVEAGIIRSNSALLASGSRVLYVGDLNCSTSSEQMYQTLVGSGVGIPGVDAVNPSGATGKNWGSSTTDTNILAVLTESATDLSYRDDYQMMSSNVYYGAGTGLALVSGTYHAFGINGTTHYGGSVNSGSDTALNTDLATNGVGISASQLYQYLTTASDHVPVVADYTIPTSSSQSPVVSSVTPSCGPTTGGTAVTITGSNFVSGATVTIGGTGASSIVVVNSNTVTAVTPANTAGAKNIVVTNPSTQSGTLINGFSYTATPSPSNNGAICSGQTLNLFANTTADSYSWTGPNSFSSTAQNPSIANATTAATGTYNLTVTSNGCTSAVGSTTVAVNQTPATPSPSSNGPVCSGQTLNLFANTTADSYSWTGPNSFSSSAQNPSIANATTAATGTYNLTVTSNGCTSAVGSTTVTVNQTPATPSPSNNGPIYSGQTLNLSANTTADSYSWTGPNSFGSSAQNPSIANATTAATGTYNLTVTSSGCTSAAGSTSVTVNPIPANGPTNFYVTALATRGSDVVITWVTGLGGTNVVQSTTGLADGSYSNNFIDVSPWIILPAGSGDFTTNYPDPGGAANAPYRYYRIRLQP